MPGVAERLGLRKRAVAVPTTRDSSKHDMINNNALPEITVDPETYDVRGDGEFLTCDPVAAVPMAQRYFLF